jgi:hypothetical protein
MRGCDSERRAGKGIHALQARREADIERRRVDEVPDAESESETAIEGCKELETSEGIGVRVPLPTEPLSC